MATYTKEEIYEKVSEIVKEQLGVKDEQITPEANFVEDLKADSLGLVELMMGLEEAFTKDGENFEIKDEDAEKIVTVQDAVDFIYEKKSASTVAS